ncbi:AAA family ATPase, partial [uncultured Clostridium sp.]|uniref:AAA family ATPase n=1 Tax=uncultured Clostridium sp. TaxID=59620 RepID=UPI0025CF6BC6
MKKKPLPVGIDNFEKLITRGYYFVDKTMLIKDLLDNKADVNLFTRPRRFGKTLNMSMLQYFF